MSTCGWEWFVVRCKIQSLGCYTFVHERIKFDFFAMVSKNNDLRAEGSKALNAWRLFLNDCSNSFVTKCFERLIKIWFNLRFIKITSLSVNSSLLSTIAFKAMNSSLFCICSTKKSSLKYASTEISVILFLHCLIC